MESESTCRRCGKDLSGAIEIWGEDILAMHAISHVVDDAEAAHNALEQIRYVVTERPSDPEAILEDIQELVDGYFDQMEGDEDDEPEPSLPF